MVHLIVIQLYVLALLMLVDFSHIFPLFSHLI